VAIGCPCRLAIADPAARFLDSTLSVTIDYLCWLVILIFVVAIGCPCRLAIADPAARFLDSTLSVTIDYLCRLVIAGLAACVP